MPLQLILSAPYKDASKGSKDEGVGIVCRGENDRKTRGSSAGFARFGARPRTINAVWGISNSLDAIAGPVIELSRDDKVVLVSGIPPRQSLQQRRGGREKVRPRDWACLQGRKDRNWRHSISLLEPKLYPPRQQSAKKPWKHASVARGLLRSSLGVKVKNLAFEQACRLWEHAAVLGDDWHHGTAQGRHCSSPETRQRPHWQAASQKCKSPSFRVISTPHDRRSESWHP